MAESVLTYPTESGRLKNELMGVDGGEGGI